jgi:hypothetical protein
MELRKIREAEWREYVKRPQLDVEYFDIEEEAPFPRRIWPKPRIEYSTYRLDTYEKLVMPMKRKYKQLADTVKEIARRHGIHRRLLSALVSLVISATRRNMIGSIACLKRTTPWDYVSTNVYTQCMVLFKNEALCLEIKELARSTSQAEYSSWRCH